MKALFLILQALLLFQSGLTQTTESDSGKVDCPTFPPGVNIGYQCPFDFDGNGYCSYSTDANGGETQTWAGNTCDACSTGDYYIPGECPGDKVYCDTYANPPENCSDKSDPVCGYYSNVPYGDNAEYYVVGTFMNACTACQVQVNYYVKGKCINDG